MCKNFCILILIFCSIISGRGQNMIPMKCGTTTTDEDIQLLLRNKEFAKKVNRRNMETIWVPIHFHLVGTSEGNGRISATRLLEGLCKLNQDFESTNIQFYLTDEVSLLDNSAMYDMEYPPIPEGVRTQFTLQRVQGAVNVFIGNGLTSGNSGFYTSSADVIYMDKAYFSADDVILAHELGHFFGLPHTFFGWEETTYDPELPTPTEVFRGNNSYNVEYVDRSVNCEESGDFFCGTPADYILDWNGGCDYTGGAVDPDSVLLDPDETNFMAYYSFVGCEEYTFAEDQTEAMIANYMNRGEFANTSLDEELESTEAPILTFPMDNENVPGNSIELMWSPAQNATHYLVQVSRLPNFFALDVQTITTSTELTIEDLNMDRKYYWRVLSFNKSDACVLNSSEEFIFNTVEETSAIKSIESSTMLKIARNPIVGGDLWKLESKIERSSVTIEVYNLNGMLVLSEQMQLLPGQNVINNTELLQTGTYFLAVKGIDLKSTFKIIKL